MVSRTFRMAPSAPGYVRSVMPFQLVLNLSVFSIRGNTTFSAAWFLNFSVLAVRELYNINKKD